MKKQENLLNKPNDFNRWMIVIAVMLATIIEILDMTIVNVSLPQMMGELGVNSEQVTWILTTYIVAAAVIMPLTGFLVDILGQKNLLLINIFGFLISSVMCGAAVSFPMLVFFRTLQGVFGASLVPLSQHIIYDVFPKDQLAKGMAIWGIGIMVAPVLGPTLGGYITETMSWRWVFYINVPICLLAFFMALQFVVNAPKVDRKIDWIGMIIMAIGIGFLQVFLDTGNSNDWFNSKKIVIFFVICVFSIALFFMRGIDKEDNIVNLNLFKNRDFSTSTFMLSVFCAGMFGVIASMPLMLEKLMGYSPKMAGILMAPRAFAATIGMFVVVKLKDKNFDLRIAILIGIVLSGLGAFLMCSYSLQSDIFEIIYPTIITGIGNGMLFVPLAAMALGTLSKDQTAEGSGLYNFGRNLGSSIGVSITSTLIAREAQINWNRLAGHVNQNNFAVQRWLATHHLSINSSRAIQTMASEIYRQSMMISFLDVYFAVAISFILMIPLVFLLKPAAKKEIDIAEMP